MTYSRKSYSLTKPAVIAAICSLSITVAGHAAPLSPGKPEGWLPNFESMITLAVVVGAFLIAWLLNHRESKARSLGTALAGLSCFGVVARFTVVLGTGVLDNPKPFQAPMDGAKPVLLWAQTFVALVAGFALLFVANRQRKGGIKLKLNNENEATRYGRVSRTIHWTTAILFILMIPTGIFASMIPAGVWFRSEYIVFHKTIGIILFGLVIFRLLWNRRSRRPEMETSLMPIEKKMAHAAHVMLYLLMLAIPFTGYFMTSFHGYPSYFFTITIPPLVAESDIYVVWGLFHKYLLQYLVYVVLGAHILGALKHQLVDKHINAFKRMVS